MCHRNRILGISFCFLVLTAVFAGSLVSAAELTPDQRAKAEKLHKTKCSKCHKLYEPADYDDVSWDRWMEKMRKKARLKDEQYDLITRYLASVRSKT